MTAVSAQDGPAIGGIVVFAGGGAFILSAVLRSLRGGAAYLLDRRTTEPVG